MKKLLTLMLVFSSVLCLAGCSNKPNDDTYSENSVETSPVDTYDDNSTQSSEDLKDPELTFYQVYNPNGFDTFTGIIHNPNKTDIDVTFDVVYYKDNVEVARNNECFASPVQGNGDYVVFVNYEVPKPEDVDMVKLENVITSKAYYTPLHAEYTYVGNANGYENFEFKFENTYNVATVCFLLYNDNNKNDKLDNGELVVVSTDSEINGEENFKFDPHVFGYEKYEVYYYAY